MSNTPTTEAPAMPGKTIIATVYFRLSEAGQRAALLAGKPAMREQSIAGEIPIADLDMCAIQPDGTVICKECRTYTATYHYSGSGMNLSGKTEAITLDAPPASAAELLAQIRMDSERSKAEAESKIAAEAAERTAKVAAHLEAETAAIKRFLRDQDSRGEVAYNGLRLYAGDGICDVTGSVPGGRAIIISTEHPQYVEVEAEAKRRNAADIEAKQRAETESAAAKLAAIRAWLRAHGTQNQLARFEADLLPEAELVEAMSEVSFAPLASYPLYRKLTEREIRDAAQDKYAEVLDSEPDIAVKFRTVDPESLTAEQWDALQAMRAAMPGATIEPKLHEGTLDSNDVPWGVVERTSAIATITVAGVKLRREYAL